MGTAEAGRFLLTYKPTLSPPLYKAYDGLSRNLESPGAQAFEALSPKPEGSSDSFIFLMQTVIL
jgi:hypothetical protein